MTSSRLFSFISGDLRVDPCSLHVAQASIGKVSCRVSRLEMLQVLTCHFMWEAWHLVRLRLRHNRWGVKSCFVRQVLWRCLWKVTSFMLQQGQNFRHDVVLRVCSKSNWNFCTKGWQRVNCVAGAVHCEYIPHFAFDSPHTWCDHPLQSIVYTPHIGYSTPHTLHSTLQTLHSTHLHTPPSPLYILHFTLYNSATLTWTLHWWPYATHSAVHNLHTPHSPHTPHYIRMYWW